jgi:hypothetical protein
VVKAIWAQDEASYAGEHVSFERTDRLVGE